jgi:multiple sugar transport system permease protein
MPFAEKREALLTGTAAKRVKRLTALLWSLARAVLLLGIGFIILYPVLFMLTMSLKTYQDIVNPAVVWLPRTPTAQNFIDAMSLMDFPNALKNSVMLGVVTAVLQTLSCSLIGYGFARFRFPGRGVIFGVVIFTLLVPPVTIIVPQYMQLRFFDLLGLFRLVGLPSFNMVNSPLALYLPAIFGMGFRSGIFIFLFRQFFRGQPRELDDAARVDGCGYWSTFVRIMAPNGGAIYLTVFLFSTVWNWNEYFTTAILTDRLTTLPMALAIMRDMLKQMTSGVTAMGVTDDPYTQTARLMAGSFLTITPVLLLYAALQKYFVESVERSGIVG